MSKIIEAEVHAVKITIKKFFASRLDRGLPPDNFSLEMFYAAEQMGHSLVAEVNCRFLGRKVRRVDVEERWPADWWQAVKERWFPAWALQRWPVAYKMVSVHEDLWNVCPHVAVPGAGDHLRFLLPGKFDPSKLWED